MTFLQTFFDVKYFNTKIMKKKAFQLETKIYPGRINEILSRSLLLSLTMRG